MNLKIRIKLISLAVILFGAATAGTVAANATATPEQTAKIFYEWYLKELKREGGNPIDQKATLAKYVSKRRLKEIQKWRDAEEYDADYFINAQDFDEKWRVTTTKAALKGSAATLKVLLAAPRPKKDAWKQTLTVAMIRENGVWKIDEVE